MRFLAILCVGLLICASSSHPIHISVLEAKHNPQSATLELSAKIFADDLQDIILEELGLETDLMNLSATTSNTPSIEQYLQKHIFISLNGQTVSGKVLGYEQEGMSLWVYLEYPAPYVIKTMSMTNTLLLSKYDDQKNMVHLQANGSKKTFILDRRKTALEYSQK